MLQHYPEKEKPLFAMIKKVLGMAVIDVFGLSTLNIRQIRE
jgi:hypothetical protein